MIITSPDWHTIVPRTNKETTKKELRKRKKQGTPPCKDGVGTMTFSRMYGESHAGGAGAGEILLFSTM